MYHKKTVHVNDGRVDAELVDLEYDAEVVDEESGLLPLVQLVL